MLGLNTDRGLFEVPSTVRRFPEIRGTISTILGAPIVRIMIFSCLYWGHLFDGNYQTSTRKLDIAIDNHLYEAQNRVGFHFIVHVRLFSFDSLSVEAISLNPKS